MKNSKKLAIIGSRGMVGSDLVTYLQPKFTITEINRDNYTQHRGENFDYVINANGNSSKVWANKNVLEDFEASTNSVYHSLFDFPCKTYVYLSSADVYPDHTSKKATSESQIITCEKLSPYGFHKYLSECIVKNVAKNYLILRCPMILGTNLKKGPIYDLLRNKQLFISRDSAFQMITTKEIAQIISFFLDKSTIKETVNIGGKDTVSFKDLKNYVHKSITFPKDAPTHIYEMDVSKLQKIYPLKTSDEYLYDLLNTIK